MLPNETKDPHLSEVPDFGAKRTSTLAIEFSRYIFHLLSKRFIYRHYPPAILNQSNSKHSSRPSTAETPFLSPPLLLLPRYPTSFNTLKSSQFPVLSQGHRSIQTRDRQIDRAKAVRTGKGNSETSELATNKANALARALYRLYPVPVELLAEEHKSSTANHSSSLPPGHFSSFSAQEFA